MNSIIPERANKQWNDDLKQYYVEYKDNSYTKKIWIEDEKVIKSEKISLITNNNLGWSSILGKGNGNR